MDTLLTLRRIGNTNYFYMCCKTLLMKIVPLVVGAKGTEGEGY